MSDQAPPPVEYKRGPTDAGPGQDQPLPQGDAAQINDAAAAVPAPEGMPAEGDGFQPSEADLASLQGPPEPNFSPGMGTTGLAPDDEKFLFGPTDHPDQVPVPMRMIDPVEAQAWMPALRAEASRPDAPPQLKAIFKAMVLGPGA